MSDKILQSKRQKLLDLLTKTEVVLKKPSYKYIEAVDSEGGTERLKEFNGYKATHHKLKDWITAEKKYRGKSARKRLRALCREMSKIVQEVREITLELDKVDTDEI